VSTATHGWEKLLAQIIAPCVGGNSMKSKQDVFEDALDELRYAISLAKEPVAAEDLSDEDLLDDLRARYAAAGKVPVPRKVGEYIDNHYRMFTIFGAMRMAIEKIDTPLDDPHQTKNHWIANHLDTFARAWLNGWYAEKDAK
jgi:hypothetical protein